MAKNTPKNRLIKGKPMKKYTFTLDNDRKGNIKAAKVTLFDTKLESAIKRTLDLECCPESAILNIKIEEIKVKK